MEPLELACRTWVKLPLPRPVGTGEGGPPSL